MRIGRLYVNFSESIEFVAETYICKCKCLSLGFVYFVWSHDDCKCGKCKKFDCICRCVLCDKKNRDCDCEDWSA
jgi:hypothetical protein